MKNKHLLPKHIQELDNRVLKIADKAELYLSSKDTAIALKREDYVEMIQMIHDLESVLIEKFNQDL